MIKDTLSRKKSPALTSDQWHVVHARWSGTSVDPDLFERRIVSEHGDDRDAAANAARAVVAAITAEMLKRPRDQRDQVFIRPPAYKSLKTAARLERRTK